MADFQNTVRSLTASYTGGREKDDASSLMYGRVQPQAVPLEEAILGAIMLDKDALPAVIEILRPESYYTPAHQQIYDVMLNLFSQSQPIDLLTVHEALHKIGKLEEIGGVNYLMELTNKVASAANIEYHARIVAQKYIQRELIRVSSQVIKESFEDSKDVLELLDEAERNLYDITDKNLNTGYESLAALAVKAQKEIEEISAKGSEVTGVTTGFKELNKITHGWQPSDLVIIAARPGMGKTAFVLSLVKNAAEHGYGMAFFSLEMASTQLVQRLIAMESRLDNSKLRNGQMTDADWENLHKSVDKLSNLPIYIDDTPAINIFELRAKCRRLKQNHDIRMIVIDYLQLMTAAPNQGRGNREQEISSISRALKALAKELVVPVIALSQLSRAVETRGGEKRPQLSDLRESGAIEQDADIVTFIYRPEYYGVEEDEMSGPPDRTEIIIAKHRNGSLGTVNLRFIKECVSFVDMDNEGFSDLPDFEANPFSSGIITRASKMNEETKASDAPPDMNIPF
jgi:replicative DNA helicase